MFTGIVEKICTVKAARRSAAGLSLSIDLSDIASGARLGDSIAVNGVCLTIAKLSGSVADFDVSPETVSRTTIGKIVPGNSVNIEQAARPDSRLGGHLVQGHVDGTAMVKAVNRRGEFYDFVFTAPPDVMNDIVVKGSVAVNGISLTIANAGESDFTVAVIPATWQGTTLSTTKVGSEVNIETDILVKIIKKQLKNLLADRSSGLTLEKLAQMGF